MSQGEEEGPQCDVVESVRDRDGNQSDYVFGAALQRVSADWTQ